MANEIYSNVKQVKIAGTNVKRPFQPDTELIVSSEPGDSPFVAVSQKAMADLVGGSGGSLLTKKDVTQSVNVDPKQASDARIPSEKAASTALAAKVTSIKPGTNVSIDNKDPNNPIINVIGGGGTTVNVVTTIPEDPTTALDTNVPSTKAVSTELKRLDGEIKGAQTVLSGVNGLKFKAGDNTVFAKTMKDLVLGTDDFTAVVIARTEGSSNSTRPLFGFSKSWGQQGSLHIQSDHSQGSNATNSILYIGFQYPVGTTSTANSIRIGKIDSTTNLHHIVITRSGTLVTAIINGRLVKSVTQDIVLDFSNFIYDIANTQYFWGGYVFNYAMTQEESNKLLWNGGRYDEVVLPAALKVIGIQDIFHFGHNVSGSVMQIENKNDGANGFDGSYTRTRQRNAEAPNWYTALGPNSNQGFIKTLWSIKIKYRCNYDMGDTAGNVCLPKNTGNAKIITFKCYSQNHTCFDLRSPSNINYQIINKAIGYINNEINAIPFVEIQVVSICKDQCLLEYRPENIRQDRVINTGTAGSDYDLMFSPTPPEFIKEKPYTDKQQCTDNNISFHPTAMGQKCYTLDGNIYEAGIPPMSREWSVADWHHTNN